MTLDASDWVWNRSESRGLARTILLAIADKCPDASCTAYAGTAMLMQRTRAARSSVRAAVDKLLDSGELEIVTGFLGPNGETVYRLPHAVGHVRQQSEVADISRAGDRPGPDPDPGRYQAPGGPVTGPGGSGNRPEGGPEASPGEDRYPAPGGAEASPHNNSSSLLQQQQQQHAPARTSGSTVIEQLRPLVGALDAAGVAVRWSLGLGEQRDVHRLVERHGVAALVELAAHRTAPGDAPKSARYWLKVWSDLNHAPATSPAASTNVVPFRSRAAAPPASTRHNLLAALDHIESREDA
ncbi:hypothetical protein SSP35_05_02290 [Streptomyces sp. NBRC 110611]|uniref:hypothetical protein n=1 Tax=Streptomyces sp. NBRC 110611 TaxID=1621259 RepID=UPI00082A1B96|nr:hypothetical protein [Streptomyces sp. NBRC 110611]GAU67662.1 hypothetical protein SSP35_05_02290 [Streptomyces sp. NBRC 110611]